MKVKYIGAFPEGKDTLVVYGKYVMRRGEVNEIDDQFAAKVRGNRYFEIVEDAEPQVPPLVNAYVEPAEAPALKRGRKPKV